MIGIYNFKVGKIYRVLQDPSRKMKWPNSVFVKGERVQFANLCSGFKEGIFHLEFQALDREFDSKLLVVTVLTEEQEPNWDEYFAE